MSETPIERDTVHAIRRAIEISRDTNTPLDLESVFYKWAGDAFTGRDSSRFTYAVWDTIAEGIRESFYCKLSKAMAKVIEPIADQILEKDSMKPFYNFLPPIFDYDELHLSRKWAAPVIFKVKVKNGLGKKSAQLDNTFTNNACAIQPESYKYILDILPELGYTDKDITLFNLRSGLSVFRQGFVQRIIRVPRDLGINVDQLLVDAIVEQLKIPKEDFHTMNGKLRYNA